MPVNLDEVSPDLDGLLEKLSQEVSKAVSTRVTMMLDSDKEGMKIRIYYKSTYKDRDLIKDRVLRLMFREFHSISKQNKDDDDS